MKFEMVPVSVPGSVTKGSDGDNARDGPATTTVALWALSAPLHAACTGVTVYVHDPAGTPASTQLVPETVPAHAALIGCGTCPVSYRFTM